MLFGSKDVESLSAIGGSLHAKAFQLDDRLQ
jgi:hypothetical protein